MKISKRWQSIFLACFNRRAENVSVLAVIIAELELGDIERHVLAADLVERTDDAALENLQKPSVVLV